MVVDCIELFGCFYICISVGERGKEVWRDGIVCYMIKYDVIFDIMLRYICWRFD